MSSTVTSTPATPAVNMSQVGAAAQKALELTAAFAPLAALGGPQAAAIGQMAEMVATTLETVLPAVEADAQILSSGDIGQVKALQAQLQSANAELAAKIAALPD